jgi:hypothetical protein
LCFYVNSLPIIKGPGLYIMARHIQFEFGAKYTHFKRKSSSRGPTNQGGPYNTGGPSIVGRGLIVSNEYDDFILMMLLFIN